MLERAGGDPQAIRRDRLALAPQAAADKRIAYFHREASTIAKGVVTRSNSLASCWRQIAGCGAETPLERTTRAAAVVEDAGLPAHGSVDDVEHHAQILTEGDGAGFGGHGELP